MLKELQGGAVANPQSEVNKVMPQWTWQNGSPTSARSCRPQPAISAANRVILPLNAGSKLLSATFVAKKVTSG